MAKEIKGGEIVLPSCVLIINVVSAMKRKYTVIRTYVMDRAGQPGIGGEKDIWAEQ